MPWEVLVSQDTGYGSDISHRVGVSLAAGDRLTTDTCWITILRSTYNDTASGGSVPTPTKWDQINSQIVNMDYKNESVYCWGDSLTFGDGGNIDGWHAMDYPMILAQRWGGKVVNWGVPGEDCYTIMARQGSDPMVPGGFTIPATTDPVEIGNMTDGIPTRSGGRAKPLRLGEAGINPCMIAGVEGVLYRGTGATLTGVEKYYFKRLAAGAAMTVPANTPIQTFAMRYYSRGIAIIWMGANGGYSSVDDWISKIHRAVAANDYSNYIVVLSRETTDPAVIARFEAEFGEHLLVLPPLLNTVGLSLAGVGTWDGTLTNGIPAPLDAGDGLHYSYYGYKAVGCLIASKLQQLVASAVKRDSVPTGDQYGTYAYCLSEPYYADGKAVKNTRWRPYDTDKDWTLCAKVSAAGSGSNYPLVWLEAYEYFDSAQKQTALFVRRDSGAADHQYSLGMGIGGFPTTAGTGSNDDNIMTSRDGYHYLIIRKDGDTYTVWGDNGDKFYGGSLSYGIEDRITNAELYLGGRCTGGTVSNQTACEINQLRVYDSALDDAACAEILNKMKG